MSSNTLYLGLGSNMGSRKQLLDRAIEEIDSLIGPVISRSSYYESIALVLPGDDDALVGNYINAVISVKTTLRPQQALNIALAIESTLGRIRDPRRRWGPRYIDIDLLAWEDRVIQEPELIIPHPALAEREFVLVPFVEIAENFVHPISRLTVAQLLEQYYESGGKQYVIGKLALG